MQLKIHKNNWDGGREGRRQEGRKEGKKENRDSAGLIHAIFMKRYLKML